MNLFTITIAVVVAGSLIAFSLFSNSNSKNASTPPEEKSAVISEPTATATPQTFIPPGFKGPTGPPRIKGPTSNPPNY